MTTEQIRPTKLELTILRVLWEAGPRSVRDIQTILSESKPTGVHDGPEDAADHDREGLVERDETVRPQIYRARYSQDRTQKQLLRDFIQRAYGGSVKALVMHALATRKSSPRIWKRSRSCWIGFEGGGK